MAGLDEAPSRGRSVPPDDVGDDLDEDEREAWVVCLNCGEEVPVSELDDDGFCLDCTGIPDEADEADVAGVADDAGDGVD